MEEQTRDCKACIYSKNGKCAGTEECHECMWENKFKQKSYNEVEDCISREAVLETIEDCNSDGLKGIFCSYNDGERFKEYIKALPSVTPKEKTAAWVPIDAEPHDIYECNACG